MSNFSNKVVISSDLNHIAHIFSLLFKQKSTSSCVIWRASILPPRRQVTPAFTVPYLTCATLSGFRVPAISGNLANLQKWVNVKQSVQYISQGCITLQPVEANRWGLLFIRPRISYLSYNMPNLAGVRICCKMIQKTNMLNHGINTIARRGMDETCCTPIFRDRWSLSHCHRSKLHRPRHPPGASPHAAAVRERHSYRVSSRHSTERSICAIPGLCQILRGSRNLSKTDRMLHKLTQIYMVKLMVLTWRVWPMQMFRPATLPKHHWPSSLIYTHTGSWCCQKGS